MFLGRTLRSRVARRIFTLFVVCALVPIIGLAVVSFLQVRSQLTEQSAQRLHDAAKGKALAVFERLSFVETELSLLAPEVAGREDRWNEIRSRLDVERHFEELSLATKTSTVSLLGPGELAPRLSADDLSRLRQGQAVLRTDRDSSGRVRIWMALASGDSEASRALVARVRNEYLWAVEDLPARTELTVLDEKGNCLFTTLSEAALDSITKIEAQPRFHVVDGERDLVSSSFALPLRFAFGSQAWTVVVSEPEADVFRSASEFMRAFPLVILLSLWVVLFLSIGQIRRSLHPLERLKDGTRRIGAGLFDTRVQVRSGDEFEELAESMNGMSKRLGRQFHALTTMAEIDRALLSALQTEEVIQRLLRGLFQIVGAERATISLAGHDGPQDWQSFSTRRELPESVAKSFLELSPKVLRELREAEAGLVVEGSDSGSEGSRLLLPVVLESEISAVLTLEYGPDDPLHEDEQEQARHLTDRLAVALTNARLIERVDRLSWGALVALARAIDAKSPWTAGHSERAAKLAVAIGANMGLDEASLEIIHRGGLLHDIGKIGIPPAILDKKGKLTDEERAVMQEHPVIGARILEPIEAYARFAPVVLQHHEWFDGSGYPDGVAGESISLYARVYAVADVYDALFADRPYRAGLRREEVIDYIQSRSGTQFDPDVVRSFLAVVATHGADVEERSQHLHHLTGAFATAPAFRSGSSEPS